MRKLIIAAIVVTLSGCASIGSNVNSVAQSDYGLGAAHGIAGQLGQQALAGAGFVGWLFSRGAPSMDNCVNGLGQKLNCETGEVLPGQDKPKSE